MFYYNDKTVDKNWKMIDFQKPVDKVKKWCYNIIGFKKPRKENVYEKRWIRENKLFKNLQWVYG